MELIIKKLYCSSETFTSKIEIVKNMFFVVLAGQVRGCISVYKLIL